MPKINSTVTQDMSIVDMTAGWLRRTTLFGLPLLAPDGSILTDDTIQQSIDAEISDLSQKSSTPFQATKVFTAVDPNNIDEEAKDTDYHEAGQKIDYRKHDNSDKLSINLPTSNLISVESVRGTYGIALHWDVPTEWLKVRKNGRIDIIPTYGVSMQYPFGANGMAFSGHMLSITNSSGYSGYWAVNYTYGLERIPLNLAQYIQYAASLIVIENLATAFSPGLASKSTSLGGISQSVSFTASAEFSLYSALTKTIKEKLKSYNLDEMIRQTRGLKLYSI